MQCYTELVAPSAITHAVALPFLGPHSNNLVVAKTSLLQVYNVKQINGHERDGEKTSSKLVLVGEYPLSGTVTSLASIKVPETKTGGDALIIAFQDAKLSLLEWDSENHRTSTISIHYYEGENIINQPFGPRLGECDTILTVDPSARCAALKFGSRHLAILPFRQLGDDLADEAEDVDTETAPLQRVQSNTRDKRDGDNHAHTPYKASFVLPLTTLDPGMMHPVDLAFLHEYRTPTLGILSGSIQPSSALLETRKDVLNYTVFTLDLEQRASTNLIALQNLPSDLWKVVPLPPPVGGVLLVGTNELVHVDQSGKPNAVAVNEFATSSSSFGMTDQSDLNMQLEDCEIEFLDPQTGDVLIVLRDGLIAILKFQKLGRNVSGLHVMRVQSGIGESCVSAAPSCVAAMKDNTVFIGGDNGKSTLLCWRSDGVTLGRKRSHAEMLGHDGDEDDNGAGDIDDDDDLYAPTADPAKSESVSRNQTADAAVSYTFTAQDILPSLGPINSICFGQDSAMASSKLELVATTGRQESSGLAFLNKEFTPEALRTTQCAGVKNAWTADVRSADNDESAELELSQLLVLYDGKSTKVYDLMSSPSSSNDHESADAARLENSSRYVERTGTNFEQEGETIDIGTLNRGTCLVHCRRHEVRTYEAHNLALSHIIPMTDDETDTELDIVHTSFSDPYLLVTRSDNSIQVLRSDKTGDVELLDLDEGLGTRKWESGCLFTGELSRQEPSLFLLGKDGGLHVFSLPELQPVYSTPMLAHLPPVLTPDLPQRRLGAKTSLTEILVADIGAEGTQQTYLVLRSNMDDLTLYEAFYSGETGPSQPWTTGLRWRKVPSAYVPKFDDVAGEDSDGRSDPLKPFNIGGRHLVYSPGSSSSIIMKEPHSLPKVIPFGAPRLRTILRVSDTGQGTNFAFLSADQDLIESRLPEDMDFSSGWSVRQITLGSPPQEVRHVAYHRERKLYIAATCREVDFYFAEDDTRHQEQDEITLRPKVSQYTLHLVSAKTRSVVHSLEMPYQETITSMKVMTLEASEHSHQQRSLVVVGTAALRGEDMPAKGAISVFELLDVVPDPDLPESGVHLHPISREETKGAVTAIEPFGHGLIGTAQGQKIMIRGLKEDGSCLPVAFLDAQCHMPQLKALGRTGLWIAGDAWRGVWFGGFVEEPYKLSVLGKSRTSMEVITAEFLPFDGQLFILVIDAAMDLHVLQYDPENPKSVSGTRLLHRSTFHIGHFPTSMTLLPSTIPLSSEPVDSASQNGDTPEEEPSYQILTTSLTGSIGLITPVNETSYRRLGALQTNLTSVLEHTAGLNPRAYRAVEGEGLGSRGVLDGGIIRRIGELGSARRAEMLARAGSDVWSLRADLDVLGGGGLGFL